MNELKDLIKKYCIVIIIGYLFDIIVGGFLFEILIDNIKDHLEPTYTLEMTLRLSSYILYSIYTILVIILIKRDSKAQNSYLWSIIAVTFFYRTFGVAMFLLYTAFIKLKEENQSQAIQK
jgi:hypothetical protein